MAGMSLVSSLPPPPGRKTTASTVSSSPSEIHDDGEPLPSNFFAQGIVTDSPRFETKRPTMSVLSQTQPPGLSSAALPSSLTKPGHRKDSSGSPSLTLTPNSSVDGNPDWLSVGRQASPFHAGEVPLPFLNTDGRQSQVDDIAANFSALAVNDGENDGLLGLDALHERSHSFSGQTLQSNSPPVSVRGYFSSEQTDYDRSRSSRDRPPLSQSYGEPSFLTERSIGGLSSPFNSGSSRSIGEANNGSLDYSGFGAIGRPELRQNAAEYDPNRQRSSSQDNLQNPFYHQQQQAIPDQLTNKFRTLPSLSSQVHQQQKRLSEGFNDVQKARHVRSISQPGYPNGSGVNPHLALNADSQFYSHQPHSYPEQSFKSTRSASISHNMIPQAYDGIHYDKPGNSMPNLNASYGGFQSYPPAQRRDIYDYHGNLTISDDGHYNSISPLGQSPHQMHYSSHIRQASEGALLSPSAMSMGMGVIHGHVGNYGLHSNTEDDLADQLAGEHIDFPDMDDPHTQGVSDTFFLSQPQSHPLLRNATHAHSMSLDAIPSQYMDSIHRPTAGASLPMPKVVYAVKFKRSQRNFVPGPRISRDLKIGTYIKVEADRGEDLGIVVGKVAAEKYSFASRTTFSAGIGPPPSLNAAAVDLKRIVRLATHDEVSLLCLKREEEEELLKICRRKVRERLLPMNVVDAEYQFDRHKLTFFFEAEGRVDFRELVRDLFSMYKTRIWMQQLDKNTSTSSLAITSPQISLQMDYGTPIIAPPSEFADSIILNGMSGFDSRPI